MKTSPAILALLILAFLIMASFSVSAQQPTQRDPLLDHLAGSWILQGTIAGRETTHDIESEWVLGHEYLRIHETSREVSPRMKQSSLLNGANRRVNTSACGSTQPAAAVSQLLLPKANAGMTKSRSFSATKMIKTAASAQHSPTAKVPTLGTGVSITKAVAS